MSPGLWYSKNEVSINNKISTFQTPVSHASFTLPTLTFPSMSSYPPAGRDPRSSRGKTCEHIDWKKSQQPPGLLYLLRKCWDGELVAIWHTNEGAGWFRYSKWYMGVSKNSGFSPKMDGENNGKPYVQMDDLGGKPTIFGNTHIYIILYITLQIIG